ncbi:sodium channel protein Nach-like [Vanessa cardui]|uniref:sodium channel protein Nach-like n=1 Tax=Vanessa cardui TaxID=171605 RepID=UPI001F130699|nr:sodium channel protein Nach-like [Vanessa cardui]
MRTVDPNLWSKKVTKPILNVSRPIKFGLNEFSGAETRFRKSFHEAMVEFCRNSSVEGFRFILDKESPKPIRLLYLIVLLVTMVCGLIVVAWNIHWFWHRPRLTVNQQTVQHPVQQIDFPAVAICSYNIISRSALDDYAKYIYLLDTNHIYTMKEIKQNLLTFGALHSRSEATIDPRFVSYLDEVARETNVTNILYKLSPKCESMLVRCSWRAQRTDCQRLFATRLATSGFCCIFNSRYSTVDRNNPPRRVNMMGQDAGLRVVVREDADDFTLVRHPGDNVEVDIFDGIQFPTIRAGVFRFYAAARNASVFFKLSVQAQEPASSLQSHSDKWLGCSLARGAAAARSWSLCVARCRARAALALCGCAPHTLPPPHDSARVCSLEHLACLAKHKEKFSFLYPGEGAHESLSEERQDSVWCAHCRVGCARLRYSAEIVTSPHTPLLFLNRFFKGLDLTNTTIISIYYEKENQRLYLLDIGLRWYEVFAAISSQCVFVVGLTVLSVIEFIYHLTFRWYHYYMLHWRQDRRLRNLKKTQPTNKINNI